MTSAIAALLGISGSGFGVKDLRVRLEFRVQALGLRI